jgi:hypothetical protein
MLIFYDAQSHVFIPQAGPAALPPNPLRLHQPFGAMLQPFAGEPAQLSTVPVLPVALVETPGGADLLRAHDKFLRAPDVRELGDAFGCSRPEPHLPIRYS